MVLTKCPDCSARVSLKAATCPTCGCPLVSEIPPATFNITETNVAIKKLSGGSPKGALAIAAGELSVKSRFSKHAIGNAANVVAIRFTKDGGREGTLVLSDGASWHLREKKAGALPTLVRQLQQSLGRMIAEESLEVTRSVSMSGPLTIVIGFVVGIPSCIFLLNNGTPTSANVKSIPVNQTMFGDRWPFKDIKSGKIECHGSSVVFVTSAARYSLNGRAKTTFDYPYPHELGILKRAPADPAYPDILVNADTEVLRRLCD